MTRLFSGLDNLVSSFASRDRLYHKGLGDVEFLGSIAERHPRNVGPAIVQWNDPAAAGASAIGSANQKTARVYGRFRSPAAEWLPDEVQTATFEMIRPANYSKATPVFIHFSATGDETYVPRRLLLGNALADRGIASVILMNPYYGTRRPKTQRSFTLPTVSDQMRMNGATIYEGVALVRWLEALGHTNVGVTGVSMGGSMAASITAMIETPLRSAICMGPVGPAPAFTEGALAGQVDWPALAKDYDLPYNSKAEPARHAAEQQAVKDALNQTMGVVDLRGYAPPPRPDQAILVGARHDGYVPAHSVKALHDHWPGCELRWIEASHVTAVMLHSGSFFQAIVDAANRPA